MNRTYSFPLLFDRRLSSDIQRIAAVLDDVPPDGLRIRRDVRRRRSAWRTAMNLGALALMVLAFLATLYYLGLAV